MYFDDFRDCESINYSLLRNSVCSNKVSHAYLFDTHNSDIAFDFVFSFIKMLVCKKHFSNYSLECKDCHICSRIDDGNYSEIKIIEPINNVIRKEQLLELQEDFSKFGIESSYRIYIIKDCDKMNKHASNSILKFLEEPVDGVIAILMTNNFQKVLRTIVSRCQVIHLHHVINFSLDDMIYNFSLVYCNSREEIDSFVNNDSMKSLINDVLSFILYFEENGIDVLLFNKNMWYNNVKAKEDYLVAFQVMIYFYYDVLKCLVFEKNYLFCNKVDFIEKIASLNSVESISKKLDIVQYGYDMIAYNLNVNLLLDDIVFRLGDVV